MRVHGSVGGIRVLSVSTWVSFGYSGILLSYSHLGCIPTFCPVFLKSALDSPMVMNQPYKRQPQSSLQNRNTLCTKRFFLNSRKQPLSRNNWLNYLCLSVVLQWLTVPRSPRGSELSLPQPCQASRFIVACCAYVSSSFFFFFPLLLFCFLSPFLVSLEVRLADELG